MSIQEGNGSNKRTVLFDTQHMLDNKIDELIFMMSKLSTQGSNQSRAFKPKMYQGRRRGQGKNNYCDRGRQWDGFKSLSGNRYRRTVIEISFSVDKTT